MEGLGSGFGGVKYGGQSHSVCEWKSAAGRIGSDGGRNGAADEVGAFECAGGAEWGGFAATRVGGENGGAPHTENELDGKLVLRIAQGDEEAMRELIVRHQDRVYGTVARMIGGAGPDAEDLAQQIFIRIWKAAGKYRAEAKFTTWLMTVTRNLVFTFCETRGRKLEVSDTVLDSETEEVQEVRQPVEGRTPREDLAGKELIDAVKLACAGLPPNQRLVVHLREHEEMDFFEIGKVLGISELGAKSLMHRARENLKIKLSEFFTEPR